MSSLVDHLTASGGSESIGFLNDIVAQLWPNINVAGSDMTKKIAEPMFAEMLPGPLASLKFVKIDLGKKPMTFHNVDVHKTEHEGIKLDMDLDWDGECDIELDGKMVPKVGVEHVKLQGRLSVLLCPLTNVIPLVGAAQVAFINPPSLKLDFTDAANIADCSIIDKCVRKIMLSIISSMAVIPNRFLVKLDAANDYLKTFQYDEGVLRLTVEKASKVVVSKKGGAGGFLSKIIKDTPDCYCKVDFGPEEWKTSTKKNETDPEWNETKDFLLSDHDQAIFVDVQDDDLAGDDDIGIATTTAKKILLAGGTEELTLVHNGSNTSAKLTLNAQLHKFVPDIASFTADDAATEGRICGLATVLVAGAFDVKGDRSELTPSVKITWGDKTFSTAKKSDCPGTDVTNPSFDSAFRFPIDSEAAGTQPPFNITLLDGGDKVGSVEVPFADVLAAPEMVLADKFDIGDGTTVRASFCVRGTELIE
ncbi:hypothetical protein MKZ38_000052 [Zalerion maritima]|uniref:C2 domain-containing protein n=1 Tax=Zalerion maritima TaxID=339359 RepID=A0AAD5RRZ0_9PEZI|nr:hypothetical protein MKZ38_000052 [Zalerion maritima]